MSDRPGDKHTTQSITHSCAHCTQTDDSIASNTRRIIYDICAAMNDRDFDISKYPWTCLSVDFLAEPGVLFVDDRLDRQGWIDRLVQLTSDPGWRGEIKSLEVRVNKKRTRVDVFACFDFHGVPLGTIRPAVGAMEFRAVGGSWKLARFSTASGLSGAESGEAICALHLDTGWHLQGCKIHQALR